MINDRITLLIQQLNMNPNSFADSIGVKGVVIYNIVKGRRSKPSFEVLQKILITFNQINANWLLRGDGNLWKEDLTTEDLATAEKAPSISIEEKIDELINDLKITLPESTTLDQLQELISTLVRENLDQKYKIMSLYKKQDQILDLINKKLSINI